MTSCAATMATRGAEAILGTAGDSLVLRGRKSVPMNCESSPTFLQQT
jgi:hypothetical protein